MALPEVIAEGILPKDATFWAVNDRGGFLKILLKCRRDDPRIGDPNPTCMYNVEKWISVSDDIVSRLQQGTNIRVIGQWDMSYSKNMWFHTIKAKDIEVLDDVMETIA